jgi:hypothetical protein
LTCQQSKLIRIIVSRKTTPNEPKVKNTLNLLKKKVKLRYIGCEKDVIYNKTVRVIENESRVIPGICDIVNVCIRPDTVSFNIYVPEIITVRVRSKEAVMSQRALFEVLWGVAK